MASSVTDALAAEMPSQNSRPPVARFLLGLDDSSDAHAGTDRS
jgi:hypothetical protein